jgi:hypothetical protein
LVIARIPSPIVICHTNHQMYERTNQLNFIWI